MLLATAGDNEWGNSVTSLPKECKIFLGESAEVGLEVGCKGVGLYLIGGLGIAEIFVRRRAGNQVL
jgi:hypothetical protein